jgi:SH3 domain protein
MRMCLLALLTLALIPTAFGETVYISDVVNVPLRSGPSLRHKILNAGLPSGTRLETLAEDTEAGFTQVRLRDGTEGWVSSQYLTREPIARVRLAAATQRIETLQAELQSTRETLQQASAGGEEAASRNQELSERNRALAAELAELKRISANAIALNQTNQELESRNSALEQQVDDAMRQIASLERDVRLRWLLFGGGLVLLGVALGYALNSRRKRSTWA